MTGYWVATPEVISERVESIVRAINADWSLGRTFVRADADTVARVVRVFGKEREWFLEGNWYRKSDVARRIEGIKGDIWESEFKAALLYFDVADPAGLLAYLTRPADVSAVA